MNKLLDLVMLKPLAGVRTKLCLIVGAVVTSLVQLNVISMSPDQYSHFVIYLGLIATYFGIEHFEPRSNS